MFLRQNLHALAVLAEAASDDLQQCLAGVRYQQDTPVVAALCPILLFMEYLDDGIFSLIWHLAPPPNTNDDVEQFHRSAGSPLRVILTSLTETPSGSTAFPFANERMESVSSCIVGWTPSGMFLGHLSRTSAMVRSSLVDLTLMRV